MHTNIFDMLNNYKFIINSMRLEATLRAGVMRIKIKHYKSINTTHASMEAHYIATFYYNLA